MATTIDTFIYYRLLILESTEKGFRNLRLKNVIELGQAQA
jgi:hypothetical protein